MSPHETIRFSIDGSVATIVLHRPDVHNAYSTRMRDELYEVFGHCAVDPELHAVVLRGAGRSFCAGADLDEFGTAPSAFEARRIRFARDVWGALRSIPVPVVAALHGHVIGSGLEMALLSTWRVAAESTRLSMPEAMLGLLPAACGTQMIPRLAGRQRAAEILLLGRRLAAADAAAAGLVDEVVGDDALDARVTAVARMLSERPRPWLVALVRLLRLQDELALRDAIRVERLLADAVRAHRTRSGGRSGSSLPPSGQRIPSA